jgi:hypothetical protein
VSRLRLDPIVPLSVALAESPGSYAFFLGSGVSRDAGLPTGGEVLREALRDLQRLESDATADSREELQAWLQRTGRADASYSTVLEALVPQADDRRAYLSRRLEGREPGPTHRRLVRLAADGWVRVFITTNFDRLLEQALRDVGIEPVVVADDDDLSRAPAREHADCFVLKVHGDMLQRTIRNTDAELAALDPGMQSQLQEVLDRYGVVVLGYSGSDPAVREAFARRPPRYGLYWQARSPLTGPAEELVRRGAGRVIERPTAADFLGDLHRKLELYRAHPAGDTPQVIDAEAIRLLSADDTVALRERCLAEQHTLLSRARDLVAEHQGDPERVADLHRQLAPALERYLASHLALIRHHSPLFDERAHALGQLGSLRLAHNASTVFVYLGQWLAWWMSYACGAYAVAVENFGAVRAIFDTVIDAQHFGRRSLAVTFPGDGGEAAARRVLRERTGREHYDAPFALIAEELRASEWLQSRYPEFVGDLGVTPGTLARPETHMTTFSLLRTIKAGQLGGERHHASWTVYGTGAEHFAERLVDEPAFRDRVAQEVFGVDLDGFDEQAVTWANLALVEGALPAGFNASDATMHLRRLKDSHDDAAANH